MIGLRPEEVESQRFFKELDLSIAAVATAPSQTPDFQVDGDALGYLVEVKRRTDAAQFTQTLQHQGGGEQMRPLGVDPNLVRVLDNAYHQLRQHDPNHDRLWIVWFTMDVHAGTEIAIETVAGTLYGVKQAILPGEQGVGATSIDCYYARPGAFERRPDVDAVMVSVSEGFCAFVNELSPRSCHVVTARFAQRLAERGALVIPSHREAGGKCMLSDRALDHRDEAAVVDDLRRRYGRPVFCLAEPDHYTAVSKLD